MAARRALAVWSYRTLIRDRRQYALAAGTLAIATCATAVCSFALWYASRPGPPTTGTATHELLLAAKSERELRDGVRAAGRSFDEVDVAYGSTPIRPRGASGQLTLSDRSLTGSFGGTGFSVLEGRVAKAPGELALTQRGAEVVSSLTGAEVRVGSMTTLGDERLEVVGIVEDPANYDATGLYVAPGTIEHPADATLWVKASDPDVERFAGEQPVGGYQRLGVAVDGGIARVGLVLSLAVLLIVAMLSAVTHMTAAQRRLREFGVLGAIGAQPRHIRGAVLGTALCVGVVGAGVGSLAGIVCGLSADPLIASLVRHDLPEESPPLSLAAPSFIVAVVVSVAAALWPARALGRTSIVSALAARRPRPHFGRTWNVAAAVAAVVSVGLAAWGTAQQSTPVLSFAPLLWLVALMLAAPAAVRAARLVPPRTRLAYRIAARDLVRHGRRSALALAALTAALAAPMSVAIVNASSGERERREPPAVPKNVVLLEDAVVGSAGWTPSDPHEAAAERSLRRIRRLLPGARIAPIHVAVDPAEPASAEFGAANPAHPTVLAQQTRSTRRGATALWFTWIATPALLRAWGLDLAPAGVDVLATAATPVRLQTHEGAPRAATRPARLSIPEASAISSVWITPRAARRQGWESRLCCWLVVAPRPITTEQHAAIFAAAGTRFAAVVWMEEAIPSAARRWSLAGGLAFGLLIVLVVLALGRVETMRDMRVLVDIGAPSRLVGAVAAWQSALLALAAATGALTAGYATWWAVRSASTDEYPLVLPPEALLLLAGLPLVAAACARLAAARAAGRPAERGLP